MTASASKTSTYAMGRSESETRRLILQSKIYGPIMRQFLLDAGLKPGMKVLDLGSGPGDVAFLAADIVGDAGSVVGIDLNADILAVARERASLQRRANVSFIGGDLRSTPLPDDFDAAIGRFVLMYTGDVTATLSTVVKHVRPGGIVAFAEGEFSCVLGYMGAGPSAILADPWRWAEAVFSRADNHPSMTPELYRAFIATGLGAPNMLMQAPLGGGDGWNGYEWAAESIRSILPLMAQYDIALGHDIDLETLAQRLGAEVDRHGYPLMLAPMITAWANKPIA